MQSEDINDQDKFIDDMLLKVRRDINTKKDFFKDYNSLDVASEVKTVFDRTYASSGTWQNMLKVKERL